MVTERAKGGNSDVKSAMLIHKPMCINLWESTLEMERAKPYFVKVLNLGWKRRKWWKDCSWQKEIALLQRRVGRQQSWAGWERAKRDHLHRIVARD